MSYGDPVPDGWFVWRDNSDSTIGEVARDTSDFVSAPASMKISSPDESVYLAAVHELPVFADEVLVKLSFKRNPGVYKYTIVGVQSFDADGKEIEWTNVASSEDATDEWSTAEVMVQRPENAVRWQIIAVLHGQGEYLIDDVTVLPL